MANDTSELMDNIVWARGMLQKLLNLEKEVKKSFGKSGHKKAIIKKRSNIILISTAIIVTTLSLSFTFIFSKPIALLLTLCLPLALFLVYSDFKKEKKKNLFRFIGKYPGYLEEQILLIQYFVVQEQDNIEEIIHWKAQKKSFSDNEVDNIKKMFIADSWETKDGSKKNCLTVAMLMTSLQSFLHKNKTAYQEIFKA